MPGSTHKPNGAPPPKVYKTLPESLGYQETQGPSQHHGSILVSQVVSPRGLPTVAFFFFFFLGGGFNSFFVAACCQVPMR